jgi:hypothetical protein
VDGDGSPLQPVVPQQEFTNHTYPRPGDYTAKLTLRNLIGKESERTVAVHLKPARTPSGPPRIDALDVVPVSPNSYAPATFRVLSKVKNAQVCVWDAGDERPLDIITENPNDSDRLITFKNPGGYVIKLVAVNGTQYAQKTEIVNVLEPPAGTITAVLNVEDQGQRLDTVSDTYTFSERFPENSAESVYSFRRQVKARPGYEISEVRLKPGDDAGVRLPEDKDVPLDAAAVSGQGARNLRLQLTDQRHTLQLTGELAKDAGLGKRSAPPPSVLVPVTYVQEQRAPARQANVIAVTLTAPGSATFMLPPLPRDWADPQRQLRLELRDGDRVLWQDAQLPRGATFTFRDRRYSLTAVSEREQAHVVLAEVSPGTN